MTGWQVFAIVVAPLAGFFAAWAGATRGARGALSVAKRQEAEARRAEKLAAYSEAFGTAQAFTMALTTWHAYTATKEKPPTGARPALAAIEAGQTMHTAMSRVRLLAPPDMRDQVGVISLALSEHLNSIGGDGSFDHDKAGQELNLLFALMRADLDADLAARK